MSTSAPPRRSTRKRVRAEVSSSDEEPPSTSSFTSKISSFAHVSGPSGNKRLQKTRATAKIEQPISDVVVDDGASAAATKPARKAPAKKRAVQQTLATPHPAPPRWRETYDAISEMRRQVVAPVDGMGCANAGDTEQSPKAKRLSILISLMLSSQTKDEVTHAAVQSLRTAIGGEITLDGMLAASAATIQGAIKKCGFWQKKTEYIMEAMKRLRDDFGSDVPKTLEELTSLKGVGPKMAFLTLQSAWNLNMGIGVDVHVERITNLLGWHRPPTKTPEQTRLNLQSWLPQDLWNDINPLLVGFGQTICLPVNRRCAECTLSPLGLDLCPSAIIGGNMGKSRAGPARPAPFVGVARLGTGGASGTTVLPGGSGGGDNGSGGVIIKEEDDVELKLKEELEDSEGEVKPATVTINGGPRLEIKFEEEDDAGGDENALLRAESSG